MYESILISLLINHHTVDVVKSVWFSVGSRNRKDDRENVTRDMRDAGVLNTHWGNNKLRTCHPRRVSKTQTKTSMMAFAICNNIK